MPLKEKVWSKDKMRMILNTGNKTFDRQTSAILVGAQIGDTILSYGVRPRTAQRDAGDNLRPVGELQTYDLKRFSFNVSCFDTGLWEKVAKLADDHGGVMVYQLHHSNNGRRITHGWIVTTMGQQENKILAKFYARRLASSCKIVDECAKYVGVE